MATILDDMLLTAELAALNGWILTTPEGRPVLANVVVFADFRESMAFVNDVAGIAEELAHHPDITISYDRVTLQITHHEAGGVTDLCITLAERIDELRAG